MMTQNQVKDRSFFNNNFQQNCRERKRESEDDLEK